MIFYNDIIVIINNVLINKNIFCSMSSQTIHKLSELAHELG